MAPNVRGHVWCILLGAASTVCGSLAYECSASSECTVSSGRKVCSPSVSCHNACSVNSDCMYMEERCDYRNLCTISCGYDGDCRPGYECDAYKQCVQVGEPDDQAPVRTAVIVTIIIVALLSFCCCFHVKRRPQNAGEAVTRHQAPNTPGNSQGIQLNDRQREGDRVIPDQPDIPDVVQDSGPPPYHSLTLGSSEEPELPPPSYDEAVRTT